jgi:hypothetical protein
MELMIARHVLGERASAQILEDIQVTIEGGRTNLRLDMTICLSTQVRKQVPSIHPERQWLRP